MMKYDVVFVVLVFRNTKDLEEFFLNFKILKTKVIVVNSYYDQQTDNTLRFIAEGNGADYITVPNNGYGYGNNRGCEYAINHYEFDYLVISNADVVISCFDSSLLYKYKNCIIAPRIQTIHRKDQNPFLPYNCDFYEKTKYYCYKKKYNSLLLLINSVSRLEREIFLKVLWPTFHRRKVYAAHGAFVIFPKSVVEKLFPIYNEKIFLFSEERHLAKLAQQNTISTVFVPEIVVVHKEDGSVSLINNIFEYLRNSFMEYYDSWYK